jgi:hypothetical protein
VQREPGQHEPHAGRADQDRLAGPERVAFDGTFPPPLTFRRPCARCGLVPFVDTGAPAPVSVGVVAVVVDVVVTVCGVVGVVA